MLAPLCAAGCKATCGVAGGLAAGALFYPLEAVEARLNLDDKLAGSSVLGAAAAMRRERGLRAFTRGGAAAVVGQAVNWAVYFAVSAALQPRVAAALRIAPGGTPAVFVTLLLSGMMTCAVVNPFWVIKARQVSAPLAVEPALEPHALEVARRLVAKHGASALFAGVSASMLNTFEGAIQWTLLSQLQQAKWLAPSAAADFAMGAIARIVGVAATYPSTVIRARMSVSAPGAPSRSLSGAAREVVRASGVAGLYSGLAANVPRQLLYGGVLTFVIEACERALVAAATGTLSYA